MTSDGEVYSTSIFIDDRCTYTYQDNAGKLRMRKWVELFDELDFLSYLGLCRCIELLALFQQNKFMYTVK